MARLIRFFVAVGLLLFVLRPATAFPVPDVPLWSLIEHAQHIVVADVERVDLNVKPPADDADPLNIENRIRDTHHAVLKVVEIWKGPARNELEIDYDGYLVCPAPGRFHTGRRMVAFLYRRDGKLEAFGGTEATRYFDAPEHLEDLRFMVKSALAIQAGGGTDTELHDRKRRWLVEAATRPGTRSDGLSGLSQSPPGWLGKLYGMDPRPEFDHLEREDQERLARLFLNLLTADGSYGSLLALLPMLEGYEDPLVDAATEALVARLRPKASKEGWLARLEKLAASRLGAAGSVLSKPPARDP